MRIVKAIAASIFIGHSVVMMILFTTVVYCAFDIMCTVDTIVPFPSDKASGQTPHTATDVYLLSFETGMMDNLAGSLFGYVSSMLLATWAMRRAHDWLALQLAFTLVANVAAFLVSQLAVYFSIRDRVVGSTIALLIECTSPLFIVGLAATSLVVVFLRSKAPIPDHMFLPHSWKITVSKLLLGLSGLFELSFALASIVWPFGASEFFSTITGYLPSPLLSIGFSIPRSIATVVVGVAVSQILFVLSPRVHRHTTMLLAPTVMMHLSVIASLTISIVSERRLGTLVEDTGTASVVDAAGAVIAFVSFLAVLVVAGVALLVAHAGAIFPAPPAAAAAVELRSLPRDTATSDAADASESGSSAKSSSTSSLEPVPAHVRLFESNVSSQFRFNHSFIAEPVPSRSRMEA